MNIFEVLSNGKSRLHEPSISAMLGYLLNPTADHGLNYIFLESFLKLIDDKTGLSLAKDVMNKNKIGIDVTLEEPYELNGKKYDVDIQISLSDKVTGKELHRIIIENKIRSKSVKRGQLNKYYEAISNDLGSTPFTIVFLTPESNDMKANSEFNSLIQAEQKDKNFSSTWLNWLESNGKTTIIEILKKILHDETNGLINPIHEYTKHTIKAFISHLENRLKEPHKIDGRVHDEKGEIVNTYIMKTRDKEYRLITRTSGQHHLIDLETGEKVAARSKFIEYLNFRKIPYKEGLTTRQYGAMISKRLGKSVNNKDEK